MIDGDAIAGQIRDIPDDAQAWLSEAERCEADRHIDRFWDAIVITEALVTRYGERKRALQEVRREYQSQAPEKGARAVQNWEGIGEEVALRGVHPISAEQKELNERAERDALQDVEETQGEEAAWRHAEARHIARKEGIARPEGEWTKTRDGLVADIANDMTDLIRRAVKREGFVEQYRQTLDQARGERDRQGTSEQDLKEETGGFLESIRRKAPQMVEQAVATSFFVLAKTVLGVVAETAQTFILT